MRNIIARGVRGVVDWVGARVPGLVLFYRNHFTEYYVPKNLNVWYCFGSLLLVVLVNQVVTGFFLVMHYKPSVAEAFQSIEMTIMRDVEWGWLIRYMHSTGASLFFIGVYLHIFRGLIYGSGKKPRELVWVLGMLMYVVLMVEAFVGYVLPWGQVSFWGAKVIISLFGVIPVIGNGLDEWIMGDYLPSDVTLSRFFALHVIVLPLLLGFLLVLHLVALRGVGSNNPDGIDIHQGPKGNRWDSMQLADSIPFHPYYTLKEMVAVCVLLLLAAFVIFFAPEFGGLFLEYGNFVEANPLVTPEDMKPVWYFAPYYAMLRLVPGKSVGVLVMFSAIAILFLVPWLDRGKVYSIRYRGWIARIALGVFVVCFVWLAVIGLGPGTAVWEIYVGRVLIFLYFAFFITMPLWTVVASMKPVPERLTSHG